MCLVNKKSNVILVIVFGLLTFSLFGASYIVMNSDYWQYQVPASLWGKGDFAVGQYFFNHDDNPGGAYDLAKAQFFYERAITQNPQGNNLLWYQSGRVDFINGNFDTALLKFEKQREYFGDTVPNVYYMTGLTYAYRARVTDSKEDWRKAEEDFQKAVSFFPGTPWPYVDLAWVYFSQGKFEQMLPLLEKGLSYESNNPWLLNMYGLALLNTGEQKLAHEYFLFAEEMAEKVTVEEWGRSYPGNNPALWAEGLEEFRSLIKKNIEITSSS
jgi:tetratricopeptide (TPR) repeat protein